MTGDGLVLVFFDLETTGLNIERDEVIEVGAIKVRNNQVIEKLNTFVRPSCNIPQLITNLTGITFEDVEKAPDVEDVKKRLKDFIGNYPLIAHNVSFDRAFLEKLLGEKIENEFFDTLELSRFFFPSLTSHSLQNLVKTLSIEKDEAHRALSDAMMMYLLFQRIVSKLEKTDPYLLHKLKEISQGIRNYELIFGENWEKKKEKEIGFKWEKKIMPPEAEYLPVCSGEEIGIIDKYFTGISFIQASLDDELLQQFVHVSCKKPLIVSTYDDSSRSTVMSVFRKSGVNVASLDDMNKFVCPAKIDYLLKNTDLIPSYFKMYFAALIFYFYDTKDFFLYNAPVYIQKNALLRLISFCDKSWDTCEYRQVCPLVDAVNGASTASVIITNHSFFFNKQNYEHSFLDRNVIFLNAFRLPKVFSSFATRFSLNDLKFFASYYQFSKEKINIILGVFEHIAGLSAKEEIPPDLIKTLKEVFSGINIKPLEVFFDGSFFWSEKRRGTLVICSTYSDANIFFEKLQDIAKSIVFVSPEFGIAGRHNLISEFSGLRGSIVKLPTTQEQDKKVFSVVPLFLSLSNRDFFIDEFTDFFGKVHKKGEKSLILFSSLDMLRKAYFSLKRNGFDAKARGVDLHEEDGEIQMMLYDVTPACSGWSEIYFVKTPTFFSHEPLGREEYLNISFFTLKNIAIELLKDSAYCVLFYIDGKFRNKNFREKADAIFVSFPFYAEQKNALPSIIDNWKKRNRIKPNL
ncbi:MAG: exonuclease domain-containing protein [Caldisericota bacterium]|nr:exonuclease domain-containing protein [Caldisericota bacterium]